MIYFVRQREIACAETEHAAQRMEARGFVRVSVEDWRTAWVAKDRAWFAARLPRARAGGRRPWWW